MNRHQLVWALLLLIPASGAAQVKLGPFTFLKNSKASVLTGNLVLGGVGLYGVTAEIPPLGALSFFEFIPGYANRLFAVTDGSSIYGEVTIISRARYMPKRKVVGFIGLGPGLGISAKAFDPTVSVILGVNYLLSDSFALTVDFRSVGLLTIGIGWHNGFGWR